MGSRARSPAWAAPDKCPAAGAPGEPGEPGAAAEGGPESPALVLAAGCALQLALDGVDVLLAPAPAAALHVCLGARSVLLLPEAPGGAQPGLQPGALLRGLGRVVALEPPGADAGGRLELLLLPGADPAGRLELELRPGPAGASPERGPCFSLGCDLPPGTPGHSPLRPLPPSPPPSAPARPPERALGPHRRARRCLFPE